MDSLYFFDSSFSSDKVLAGTDEAGAGPLAGPLVAAAVILSATNPILGINDSKKLSEKKRSELDLVIREQAIAWSIVCIEPAVIDQINIYQASIQAMREAVLSLSIQPEMVLVDARTLKNLPIPQQAIIKGDAQSASIAAASILAKVYRDKIMLDLHQLYPMYGFDRHKGYGTPQHLQALKKYGPSPIHRFSYAPVKIASENFLAK